MISRKFTSIHLWCKPIQSSFRNYSKDYHPWHQPTGHQTGINVYNCTTRSKVPLVLRNGHLATWYTCGPTVYDSPHLGHASCYVKLDIIQRILRDHFKINLITAMNITDIDDKIIKKSVETGRPWQEISRIYEKEFWDDLGKLNVNEPDVKIRVTDHIPEIVAFISKIIDSKSAYVGKDNSVYFKVNSFKEYGKLQKLNLEEKEDEVKQSVVDFALWKARKGESEPSWPSPWGNGRPGWHIECSVLASMIFGEVIDFHAGGLDLRFPHHENEEAQSCVFHGKNQWVNYWLHTGQLSTKGQSEKMSKSLKNTTSVDSMLETFTSDHFRMACILSNYRNSMEYSVEMMETARNSFNKFSDFRSDCQAYLDGKKRDGELNPVEIFQKLSETSKAVDEALRDDFSTSQSIQHLINLTTFVSKSIHSRSQSAETQMYNASNVDAIGAVDKFVTNLLNTFGFQLNQNTLRASSTNLDTSFLIDEIVELRQSFRVRAMETKNKELFQVCDDIRKALSLKSIVIKDHSKGSSWSFNKS